MANISDLMGMTLSRIEVEDYTITFYVDGGETPLRYKMWHQQDCCESVYVEDVTGDIKDLLNSPITEATEASESDDANLESGTWTFYKLGTRKGSVTIRWLGQSNGYYSESVSFDKIE